MASVDSGRSGYATERNDRCFITSDAVFELIVRNQWRDARLMVVRALEYLFQDFNDAKESFNSTFMDYAEPLAELSSWVEKRILRNTEQLKNLGEWIGLLNLNHSPYSAAICRYVELSPIHLPAMPYLEEGSLLPLDDIPAPFDRELSTLQKDCPPLHWARNGSLAVAYAPRPCEDRFTADMLVPEIVLSIQTYLGGIANVSVVTPTPKALVETMQSWSVRGLVLVGEVLTSTPQKSVQLNETEWLGIFKDAGFASGALDVLLLLSSYSAKLGQMIVESRKDEGMIVVCATGQLLAKCASVFLDTFAKFLRLRLPINHAVSEAVGKVPCLTALRYNAQSSVRIVPLRYAVRSDVDHRRHVSLALHAGLRAANIEAGFSCSGAACVFALTRLEVSPTCEIEAEAGSVFAVVDDAVNANDREFFDGVRRAVAMFQTAETRTFVCVIGGNTMPSILQPLFFNPEKVDNADDLASRLYTFLSKFVQPHLSYLPRIQMDRSHHQSMISANQSAVSREKLLPISEFVVPRTEILDHLVSLLVSSGSVHVVGLHGMGGIGKTTLAVQVCDALHDKFPRQVFVTFGQWPDIVSVLETILKQLSSQPHIRTVDKLLEQIRMELGQLAKRNVHVLIVLDDVWEARHVDGFAFVKQPHALLITSRRENVAEKLQSEPFCVPLLTDAQALKWLWDIADVPRSLVLNLNSDSRVVALIKLCGGLPLALSLVSRLLRRRILSRPSGTRINDVVLEFCDHFRSREVILHTIAAEQGDSTLANQITVFRAFDASLEYMSQLMKEYKVSDGESLCAAYALCVVARNQTVTSRICASLWGWDKWRVEAMVNVLVDLHVLMRKNIDDVYTVHDLLLDRCEDNIRQGKWTQLLHPQLLAHDWSLVSYNDATVNWLVKSPSVQFSKSKNRNGIGVANLAILTHDDLGVAKRIAQECFNDHGESLEDLRTNARSRMDEYTDFQQLDPRGCVDVARYAIAASDLTLSIRAADRALELYRMSTSEVDVFGLSEATLIRSLASMYSNEYLDAVESYNKVVAVREQILKGKQDSGLEIELLDAIHDRSLCYLDMGRLEDALNGFVQVEHRLLQIAGSDHENCISVRFNRLLTKVRLGSPNATRDIQKLEILTGKRNMNGLWWPRGRWRVGLALLYFEKFAEARKVLAEAHVYFVAINPTLWFVAQCLTDLTMCDLLQPLSLDLDKAREAMTTARRIRDLVPRAAVFRARALIVSAVVELRAKEYCAAAEFCREACNLISAPVCGEKLPERRSLRAVVERLGSHAPDDLVEAVLGWNSNSHHMYPLFERAMTE